MTIADKLYKTDQSTLLQLIINYDLYEIRAMYYPPKRVIREQEQDIQDIQDIEHDKYARLMQSTPEYTSKVYRSKGSLKQPHNKVFK